METKDLKTQSAHPPHDMVDPVRDDLGGAFQRYVGKTRPARRLINRSSIRFNF